MIGFDTNVLVRLLADDEPSQTRRARNALVRAKAEREDVLIDDVVLAETLWTMNRSYKVGRPRMIEIVEALLETSPFTFEHRETVAQALALFKTSSAGFSDCLLVARNHAAGCRKTLTFDADCLKLPSAAAV